MPPIVSVIIPAFNAEAFIADAIDSVLAQDGNAETEIIVIDDGSTDKTRTIVSDMSRNYPQITFLPNERKKGPSGARNTGLVRATGEYVAFLDADDLWLPNHLKEGIGFLEKHNGIDIVFYNFEIYEYETKRLIGDWFSARSFRHRLKLDALDDQYYLICDDMFNALLDESFMHLQSMIIKNKALNGILFNEEVKRSEDRNFSIDLAVQSKAKFAFKNIITGKYFRHDNSLTSNSVENELSTVTDHIKLFTEYLSRAPLDTMTTSKLNDMLFNRYMSASFCYRKLKSHRLAVMTLFKSFKYNIAASQLKEFAKITASFLIYNILRHTRRST